MSTAVKTTTCYMCACRCGIRVHVESGGGRSAIRYIEGNPEHPLNKGVICAKGSREFFHGRPREVVRAVRWTFLAAAFPLPGFLIVFSGNSAAGLSAAFVLQLAGLLAERWYFFAEARHPQNLYYQAIA